MQRLSNEFAFSNQLRQRLARHGLFWLAWILFFAFTYGFLPFGALLQKGISWNVAIFQGFSIAFIDAVLFMPAHMFLTYLILYWLVPRFLLKNRYGFRA
ncbi:hypothetical protein [Spirosoma validum]|uniref:Uncharacterized protein n=1 Tax=Spirosoma validum TaxID=2771355 RepID=A0A927AXQ4_9BACT|nr:hypothetical protein [Spirosoma validum]MBD2751709.1 hypothetical protein [Spirosoma validum]